MKKSDRIILTAEIQILPGHEKMVMAGAEIIWTETRKEKGCDKFLFNIKKEESTIVFFEEFKSEDAFEFHKNASHTVTFLNLLKGKVIGDGPKLTFFERWED